MVGVSQRPAETLNPHPEGAEVTEVPGVPEAREVPEETGDGDASRWSRAEAFLRARGTAEMPHPGGTLLEHLGRVRRLLADWGGDPAIQAAGLCHAAYGTDGFDPYLLPVAERATLAELIGDRAEALVYLYASCDRGAVLPRIGGDRPVVFRDRFTGREHIPADDDLRAFLEITAPPVRRTGPQRGTGGAVRPVPVPAVHRSGRPAVRPGPGRLHPAARPARRAPGSLIAQALSLIAHH
jgi:hypothetical protein